MKKTLLITENETDISCEVEGFSDIEIIGLLTYYRDKIEIACINRKSVQPENTLKRKTRIIDWLNKQENISF